MTQENQLNKKIIRTQLLAQRESLAPDVQQAAAKAVIKQILSWNVFQLAKHVALYHAFRHEIDLQTLWVTAHQCEKKTYFPVISRNSAIKTMSFLEASPHEILETNQFSIKEPLSHATPINIRDLDCLFIPVVAFDKMGYRLGMGKGYYDRALGSLKKRPCCIGIAYEFQKVETLPHDPWDIPLDVVITENCPMFF